MPPTIKVSVVEVPAKGASNKRAGVRVSNSHKENGNQAVKRPRDPKPENRPATSQWLIVPIPVERIKASPYQPRLSFDAEEMAELVASVRAKGVLQPIIVRTCKTDDEALKSGAGNNGTGHLVNGQANRHVNGAKLVVAKNSATNRNHVRYELIAGERRLRACKEAGCKTVPAIIRDDLSDAECAELALLENVQRSNLSVIEEARGYKRLMLQFRLREERLSKKVGKSVGTIRDLLKLLQLPDTVQKLLAEKKLTASHGQQLLALAAYERVCTLVAERIVRDHLTALSLQSTPLPNVADLKRLGHLVELDWRTKFDWKNQCGQCPHKAYVTSGYGSYCLKPQEWKKKQDAAIEQQKQESARILEEARQQKGQPLESDQLAQLPSGSYRAISLGSVPAGCTEACPCRSKVADPHDLTKQFPVCLDPKRLTELIQAQREANEAARRNQYQVLWQDARAVLQADVENRNWSRLATLLSLPVLQAQFCRYVDEEQWQNLTRTVASSLGVLVPWEELLYSDQEDGELYALLHAQLETQAPEKLLLLCASLLLAYEANQTVRFGGETPGLNFVLGRQPAQQIELDENELEELEVKEPETTCETQGASETEALQCEESQNKETHPAAS